MPTNLTEFADDTAFERYLLPSSPRSRLLRETGTRFCRRTTGLL
jgi:hypothetical protein